jgi:hypothetical protein
MIDGIDNIYYDKEKYKEMLLDAAETVLGIFGPVCSSGRRLLSYLTIDNGFGRNFADA